MAAAPLPALERAWRALGIALIAAVVWLSLAPVPALPVELDGGDKMGHVAAYAALMLWHAQLHPGTAARLALAAGFVALGVGLEFAQGALAFRRFDALDMAANAAGVALGWLAAPPRGPHVLQWARARLAPRQV
jgi:hypothetical protein